MISQASGTATADEITAAPEEALAQFAPDRDGSGHDGDNGRFSARLKSGLRRSGTFGSPRHASSLRISDPVSSDRDLWWRVARIVFRASHRHECGPSGDLCPGISGADLVEGARRFTLEELTEWTLIGDEVIAF